MSERDFAASFDAAFQRAAEHGTLDEQTQATLYREVRDRFTNIGWGPCQMQDKLDVRLTNRAPFLRCEFELGGINVTHAPGRFGASSVVELRQTLGDGTRQLIHLNWKFDGTQRDRWPAYMSSTSPTGKTRVFSIDYQGRAWESDITGRLFR